MLCLLLDKLYAVESARLIAEQENEDLRSELAVVNARVSIRDWKWLQICRIRDVHKIYLWHFLLQ